MDTPAVAVGVALAAIGVAAVGLSAAGIRARHLLPELVVLATAGVALAAGVPFASGAWLEAALQPSGVWLVAWAVVGAARRPAAAGPATAAVVGSLATGALATAALLVPRARTGAEAARISALCVAAGLLSPFGGAAQLLLGRTDAWLAVAFAPAVVGVAVAWPGLEAPSRLSRWTALPLVGAVVAHYSSPALGLLLALAGVGLGAGVERAVAARRLRWALAAHLLSSVALVAGLPWLATVSLVERPLAPLEAAGLGAAAGLVDPVLAAAVAQRVAWLRPDEALAATVGVALAAAPVLPIALVLRYHGGRAGLRAAALGVAPLAVALAAAALRG